MEYDNKVNLIHKLADSVGLADAFATKYGGSRYDPATGTLYCEGLALPHSSIENIKGWYKHQMEQYRSMSAKDGNLRESFMRYALAYNAILLLEENLDK